MIIESGIRTAMNAINRSAESLGEHAVTLRTRLADIIRGSEEGRAGYDPTLGKIRSDMEARGISPEESWKNLDEGERRVLQGNFEDGDLVSVGSEIALDNEEGWKIDSHDETSDPKNPTFIVGRYVENGRDTMPMTRLELAGAGAGHAVKADDYNMTRLVLTNNHDPVMAATKAANEAHNVLADAFAEHNAAFNRVEGAGNTALRVDNPMTMPAVPEGSRASYAVSQMDRLNGIIKSLDNIEMKSTSEFVEAMEELARITGRTGV